MDGAWLAAGHFAAATLMLVLALALLWLDPGSRAVRAFVALLVLRAGSSVAIPLSRILGPDDPASAAALGTLNVYLQVAAGGAALLLVALHPRPAPRVVQATIAAATLGALAMFAFLPCWIRCDPVVGPFDFLLQALPLAVATCAVGLLVASARMPDGPRRGSTRILGLAFAIEAALFAGIALPTTWTGPSDWPFLAGLVVLVAVAVVLRGRDRALAIGAMLAAAGAAIVAYRAPGFLAATFGFLLLGLARAAFPVLAAYALARHRLFDIDVRVRIAAQRATIGAIFAGVFFVVTEGSAYLLGSRFGVLAGIVAVGALVPAMGPLRRAAERVADLVPLGSAPARDLPLERRQRIYAEFALQAWADGTLAREERAFLDEVRQRLGLSADDALRLESEASRGMESG